VATGWRRHPGQPSRLSAFGLVLDRLLTAVGRQDLTVFGLQDARPRDLRAGLGLEWIAPKGGQPWTRLSGWEKVEKPGRDFSPVSAAVRRPSCGGHSRDGCRPETRRKCSQSVLRGRSTWRPRSCGFRCPLQG